MLDLTSYKLTGLAAMVVIAFCFVCSDKFASILEKPSGLASNAHLNVSPMIETRTRDPRLQERDDNREDARALLLRTASLVETGPHVVCSVTAKSHRAPPEALHG